MIDEPLRTVRVKRAAHGSGADVVREPVTPTGTLPLSLREAAGGDAAPRTAAATPLTPEQARKLLAPLPPVPATGEVGPDRVSLPSPTPSSVPPPPREAVALPYRASAPSDDAADGCDDWLADTFPVADVTVAPYLSVTFNQPMITAASPGDLSPDEVPVKLTPAIPGRWRWLGPDTLLFEAGAGSARRLPMATAYYAWVAAGTVPASGDVLASDSAWRFETPAPTLRKHPLYRRRSYGRQPVLFAAFDQRIDPAVVVNHVRLLSEGARAYPVRLATDAEVAADPLVMRLVEATPPGHWLAVVPEEPLPTVLSLKLSFVEGMPSAEGPLVTTRTQGFRFGVRGPLQLQGKWFEGDECTPIGDWTLTFSNDLDPDAFDPGLISISPEMDEATFTLFRHTDYAGSWTGIRISGRKQPNAHYQVIVRAGLTDAFGQKLQEDASAHFSVGGLPPRLDTDWEASRVLDPSGEPSLPIHTINLGTVLLRVYRVAPEQYPVYLRWRADRPHDPGRPEPPGARVVNDILTTDGPRDTRTETGIHLGAVLAGSTGHLIVEVRAVSAPMRLSDAQVIHLWASSTATWVQATGLGLDLFVDRDQALVWISRLSDGSPRAGVTVELHGQEVRGVSDATGATQVPLRGEVRDGETSLVVARAGNDAAFLPLPAAESPGAAEDDGDHDVRISAFSDRTLYHPGDTVAVKGWLRRVDRGTHGGVTLFDAAAADSVRYRVEDPAGGDAIADGSAPLSPLGGFHFQFKLPQDVSRDWSTICLRPAGGTLEARGAGHEHRILVQERRRPEYDVDVTVDLVPDDACGHAVATVTAGHGGGGPPAAAEVEWSVTATGDDVRPPNWTRFGFGDDFLRSERTAFTFGTAPPWWLAEDDRRGERRAGDVHAREDGAEGPAARRSDAGTAVFRSRTDAAGCHRLRIDFASDDAAYPLRIDAAATVFDRNRNAASGCAHLLVHAEHYVGLRSARNFVQRGEPLIVEIAVIRRDGDAIAGHHVALRTARVEWERHDAAWREVERDVQERTVVTTTAPAPDAGGGLLGAPYASCSFETPRAGRYRITASVVDDAGRAHRTELTRWVGGALCPPNGPGEQHTVALVPDHDRYVPGESAEILVQAPLVPAEGMLTLRRDGLVSSQRFSMAGPTCTLRVPIEERFAPNLHVQVDLIGAAPLPAASGTGAPDAPHRPVRAGGGLNLPIVPLKSSLEVAVVVRGRQESMEPGSTVPVAVNVSDAAGRPVADAELAVVVADAAAVALAGHRAPDPAGDFYRACGEGVHDYHNRTWLATAGSAASPPVPGTWLDEDREPPGMAPIKGRHALAPSLLFAPEVRTNALGQAQVNVTLPDRVARYRVLAVVAAGERQFGVGESHLTVQRWLVMRPVAPRFLNVGDRFELALLLQNAGGASMGLQVAVHADNAELTAQAGELVAGCRVSISPQEHVEVRFPAAPAGAGIARFRFRAAVDAGWSDTADATAAVEVPVIPPATTHTAVACGEIDAGGAVRWPVRPPRSARGSGGLEVSLSATALLTLTDAFLQIWHRPRACSEQIASRVLAVAALHDVLPALAAAEVPARDAIEATMRSDLHALRTLQHHDGGFPVREGNEEARPFHSIHAAHALARAHRSGYAVPDTLLGRSLDYLRDGARHVDGQRCSLSDSRALDAYALYVRALLDDPDPAAAAWLVDAGFEHLTVESVGWLLCVLATDPAREPTVRKVLDFLADRGGAAEVTGDYEHLLLHSDARTDAVLLEALIAAQPASGMIANLADGLLARRVEGRWGTSQENVWSVLALRRYFDTVDAGQPDFAAQVWLGDRYLGGAEFRARSLEPARVEVPLAELQAGGTNARREVPLTVQQQGEGRLHYRLGLRYAPAAPEVAPVEHGLAVLRNYEAADDPADVRRDRDGVWRVRAGCRVLVKLTLTAPARRVHVALVDPLPAGLQPLGPARVDLGEAPARWWEPPWYEHDALSDTRAEAFASQLPAGVHEYRYLARAATSGAFTAPSASVEATYTPDTFGRTAADLVVIG